MAGKKGCGGKKGRSGRKPRRIEDMITLVEGYCLSHAIQIYEAKDKETDPLQQLALMKMQFGLTKDLAGKVLARRVKISGDDENPVRVIFRASPDTAKSEAG